MIAHVVPNSPIRHYASRAAFLAARSAGVARGAAFVGRQCDRLIGYHLAAHNTNVALNGERWLLSRVGPHLRRFIDVGANVGDWTALALEFSPSATGIAVEPGEAALVRLRDRFPRVEIVAAAAGSEAGTIAFHEQPDASLFSSIVASPSGAAARQVDVVTVDGLLDRYGWDTVDMLKIDAEGYDGHVLEGSAGALRDQRIGVVQFEYNAPWAEAGSTLGGALALLADAGYSVGSLGAEGIREFDYRRLGEFFRYSNFVAVSAAAAGWVR